MRDQEKEQKQTATFLMKIPIELEKKIQKEAQKERRSRHAQVIRILEQRYQISKSAKLELSA